jgi:hypothetical protein
VHCQEFCRLVAAQSKNSPAVFFCFRVAPGIKDTPETTIFVDNQVLALPIMFCFGASRATSDNFPAAFARVFEFGNIEAHLKVTCE